MNTEYGRNFEKIKGYFDSMFWGKREVRNAVIKGRITEEDYETITGEAYQED